MGFLCTRPAGARCARAWGRMPRRPTSIIPTGIAPWNREPGCARDRLHARHAEMRHDVRATHALRLGLRRVKGLSLPEAEKILGAPRHPLHLGARPRAAHEPAAVRPAAAGRCRCLHLPRTGPARARYGPCGRLRRVADKGRPACSPRRRCRRRTTPAGPCRP